MKTVVWVHGELGRGCHVDVKAGPAYASVSPPFNRKRAKSSKIMSSSCASSLNRVEKNKVDIKRHKRFGDHCHL